MSDQSLVFLGAPASGKGTQGRRLADLGGFSYLSTGGLLRGALRDGTGLGEKARPFLDRGEYVPDEVMVPMVIEWLGSLEGPAILDGFPRTLAQAKALDIAFAELGHPLPRSVFLEVPYEELRRRVTGRLECKSCHWVTSRGKAEVCSKCGGEMVQRADDDVVRFENRLQEFERLTFPLVAFYEERERLTLIEALGSPEEIHSELRAKLSL
ncbi:nucleoside monophosphate kinase [Akkermansiaceae bacterium]|nr:nucleoside monophosphate kinase [Akkermansiaceae bacterium]MDC1206650.1 nucleoside monophosphate kinase [Akkermansiaceae bacterium]